MDADIIVVGGGVGGAIFAAHPDLENKKIIVIERSLKEQDRIVGELLQPGGHKAMKDMGLPFLLDGIDAVPVNGYGVYHGKESFQMEYPPQIDQCGLGFRNGKFVKKAQTYLESLKNVTLLEGNVTELLKEDGTVKGVRFKEKSNEEPQVLKAPLTIVSDGAMSVFRDELSHHNKKINSFFVGYVLKHLDLPYGPKGHLMLNGKSPILLYPIASNEVRILIDFPGSKPPRMDDQFKEDLRDLGNYLPESCQNAYYEAIENQRPKMMPNHKLGAKMKAMDGVVLFGDALTMRHPLTGGGMSATFQDIIGLTKVIKEVNLHNASERKAAVKTFYKRRKKHIRNINILADALYKVSVDEDLKSACYAYLKKGGSKADEPLSILAAYNKSLFTLLKHFFGVALTGAFALPISWPRKIKMIFKAEAIIRPLVNTELSK